jgi:FkbM family methyltransferase
MEEKKISIICLVFSLLLLLKKNDKFTRCQFKYILFKYLRLNALKEHENRYKEKTLQELIGLSIGDNGSYIIDDFKLCKMDKCFFENIIGMILDIVLKDEFYQLKSLKRRDYKKEILFYFYQEGPYEIDEVQIKNNDIVIDAGANIGIFSLLAAKKGAVVYAFEPQQLFFNYLKKNITLNGFVNEIKPYSYAINSKTCQTTLNHDDKNLLAASIIIDRGDANCMVNSISIDNWFDESKVKRIDFIKADIEGAERLLIDGAKKVLTNLKPKLAISTYHFPDDKIVIRDKILSIRPDYKILQSRKVLFAY